MSIALTLVFALIVSGVIKRRRWKRLRDDAKRQEEKELRQADRAVDEALRMGKAEHKIASKCTFKFLKAQFIRELKLNHAAAATPPEPRTAGSDPSTTTDWPPTTLPRYQDILEHDSSQIVEKEITLDDACAHTYADTILVVSHRWERVARPDIEGVQLVEIQRYLFDHPEIELIWVE